MSTGDNFIDSSGKIFLVQFLATKEALVPLANYPIMSERLIQLFRHLEYQNPTISQDGDVNLSLAGRTPLKGTLTQSERG